MCLHVKLYVKVVDMANTILKWALLVLTIIITLAVFSQVVTRYVIDYPLPFSEELARFLVVWIAFLGGAIAVRQKALIGMDAVIKLLPKALQKTTNVLVFVITTVFLITLMISGIYMVEQTANQLSPAMSLSMSIPYLAIPIGSFFMLCNVIANVVDKQGVN